MIMLPHSLPIDRCVNGKPYDEMSLEKVQISWLWHYRHHLSIPLYTNSAPNPFWGKLLILIVWQFWNEEKSTVPFLYLGSKCRDWGVMDLGRSDWKNVINALTLRHEIPDKRFKVSTSWNGQNYMNTILLLLMNNKLINIYIKKIVILWN